VQEWEASGKSKWAFARELGLPYQTFRKWTSVREDGQNFVEVGMKVEEEGAGGGQRTGSALVVEQGNILVHLPAGITMVSIRRPGILPHGRSRVHSFGFHLTMNTLGLG
jgi:hypothetical protein